ncbi:hypothetical protein BDZ89DRAFT_1117061 [Hymenopellis radicata]|nr:hypothetical protein BDZ89DRAFT_1117061 [Hymenopellis radicata]
MSPIFSRIPLLFSPSSCTDETAQYTMSSGKGLGDCDYCDSDFPPILSAEVQAAFCDDPDAGGCKFDFGKAHLGKKLREVPECYMCWYQMLPGWSESFQVRAAKKYLHGLREFRESHAHDQGSMMATAMHSTSGDYVMEFGRYERVALKKVPLLYLLWTRGDLSDKHCRATDKGKEYFAALAGYIKTLETSWPASRGPIWTGTVPTTGKQLRFYARPYIAVRSAADYLAFTYGDLDDNRMRKKIAPELTRLLYPPIVGPTAAQNTSEVSDEDQLVAQFEGTRLTV